MTAGTIDLDQLLREQRDTIVARFVAAVQRKDLSPPQVPTAVLVDHIPLFLDEIVAELAAVRRVRTSQDAVDTSKTAREHGKQRWALGYDLEALIREYGILRHCIFECAREAQCTLTLDELEVVSKCLSVGVAEAATEYIRFRDAELEAQKANLTFLAEAGRVLSSSLDYRSTLKQLTDLLVPRIADGCIIHLENHEPVIVHVDPAKARITEALYSNSKSAPFAAAIGTSQAFVSGVTPDALAQIAPLPEQLALMKQLDLRSWIVLPFRVQEQVFGVLTLVQADSNRHFSGDDLALATELANRAAVAIDNARLYELSQEERTRMEEATRAKDQFVAVVSHELRTPLNAILGWLRLLRSGSLDEAKRAHAWAVIERNAEAQNHLVDDLLDISRTLAGKLRINPAQMNFADSIEMAIEGIRPAAHAKHVTIHAQLDSEHSVMRGDFDRLHQVVWNLLSNAVKFVAKNGHVWVELAREGSELVLAVRDDGAGVAADFVPFVFEAFRQADSSFTRQHGGLGLGLSISKQIVELHGGTIGVVSEGAGRGATFTVRLPVSALVSTTIGVSHVPATTGSTAAVDLPRVAGVIRVLIVDDEPDSRELVALLLEMSGIQTKGVASAADALHALNEWAPHVIVSDIGMPNDDGYSLIRSIRILPDAVQSSVPVIALTSYSRNEDRTRALVSGFTRHLAKPVEPLALVNAVIDLANVRPV